MYFKNSPVELSWSHSAKHPASDWRGSYSRTPGIWKRCSNSSYKHMLVELSFLFDIMWRISWTSLLSSSGVFQSLLSVAWGGLFRSSSSSSLSLNRPSYEKSIQAVAAAARVRYRELKNCSTETRGLEREGKIKYWNAGQTTGCTWWVIKKRFATIIFYFNFIRYKIMPKKFQVKIEEP